MKIIDRIIGSMAAAASGLSERRLSRLVDDTLGNRFDFVVSVARKVLPEYRFKWPQMSWWKIEWFSEYLVRFGEDKSFNSDRKWMVYQLMRLVADVDGDTAECGVYRGATSWLICKSNKEAMKNKTHYVFDSFMGLSKPAEVDGAHWREGDLSCALGDVKANLVDFEQVVLMEGWIPSRFKEVSDCGFSFVHIDVDLYEPTRQSLEFFYPRLAVGGIIVCDDYGFETCPGATRAMDDYFADKLEKPIYLADGGGFVIKGVKSN
jgi:hypothetical protein